jgi:hypothetical protein
LPPSCSFIQTAFPERGISKFKSDIIQFISKYFNKYTSKRNQSIETNLLRANFFMTSVHEHGHKAKFGHPQDDRKWMSHRYEADLF